MKSKEKRLYCFSPEVMVITFAIEFLLAIYVLLNNIRKKAGYGIFVGLILLGIFQFAEYQICRSNNTLFWSRIGLLAITILPISGYYLISRVKNDFKFIKIGVVIAISFIIFYLFYPRSIEGATCGGNYVILNINPQFYLFYGYYYFGLLFLGIYKALKGLRDTKLNKKRKEVLKWLIVGYLSFILPLTFVYIFLAPARFAVASIMCGFAVIFAFILAFKIAPVYYSVLSEKNGKVKNEKTA